GAIEMEEKSWKRKISGHFEFPQKNGGRIFLDLGLEGGGDRAEGSAFGWSVGLQNRMARSKSPTYWGLAIVGSSAKYEVKLSSAQYEAGLSGDKSEADLRIVLMLDSFKSKDWQRFQVGFGSRKSKYVQGESKTNSYFFLSTNFGLAILDKEGWM
ncbi:MAG: hypothetical protein K8R91_03990, partial [Phycisphaerae bacterium]|nr:hypothetical protein [Phycisphaerae bacterium]